MPVTVAESEQLVDTKEAARLLSLSPITLAIWRTKKRNCGPRWFRVGKRSVRYSVGDLNRWLASCETAN